MYYLDLISFHLHMNWAVSENFISIVSLLYIEVKRVERKRKRIKRKLIPTKKKEEWSREKLTHTLNICSFLFPFCRWETNYRRTKNRIRRAISNQNQNKIDFYSYDKNLKTILSKKKFFNLFLQDNETSRKKIDKRISHYQLNLFAWGFLFLIIYLLLQQNLVHVARSLLFVVEVKYLQDIYHEQFEILMHKLADVKVQFCHFYNRKIEFINEKIRIFIIRTCLH